MDEHPSSDLPPIEPPPPAEPPPPTAPPPTLLPWEDPSRPWPGALVESIQQLVARPQHAFAGVPASGDVLRPVLFALIVGSVGVFFNSLWELVIGEPFRQFLPAAPGGAAETLPRFYYVAMMALSPLIIAVSVVLSTCIVHVALLLVGGARSGFVATLRALCYAQVAALALVVPFCGAIVCGLWTLVLEVLGVSTLHRISIGRALLGVLLPVVVCCGCVALCIALFGAAVMAGLKGMAP